MSSNTKLIITNPNDATAPLWFGEIWKHVRTALKNIGAYSELNKLEKPYLSDRLEVSFAESGFYSSYPIVVTGINPANFEVTENRKLSIMQAPNTGYSFFPKDENYVYFSLDVGGVANFVLLSIAKVLVDTGYNAFYCEQDDVDEGYVPLTSEYFQSNLEPSHS
ncbi:hypothetical protein [Comamonas sp.]|uniref:hypothetical protein n=1 Tax=Comamonas sp. TaxID=34028 RepID=UPI0012CC27F8|nr:hypothetical protein [Comamonas sp.]MPS92936.1 hypothetical protein [Comamonas sp.]